MTDDRTIIQEEGDKLVAAEYVLGVLGAAERRQAQQRMAHDQAFADEVAFWEERLGAFVRRGGAGRAARAGLDPHRARRTPARSRDGAREPVAEPHLLAQLRDRRGGAGGGEHRGADLHRDFAGCAPPLLATLGASNGQPTFVAAVNAGGTGLLVVPAALLTSDPRAMELWLIPAGDKPHSLGLIEPGRPVHLAVPRELAGRLTADAALAVSMEPPGGSPTGQPTGPIVASGKLTSL